MTETILPHELPDALDRVSGAVPDTIKVLSLDCFDTLLWRDCHAPSDLFAALPDLSTGQRIVAETNARKAEANLRRRTEVGLRAIYDHAMPNAGPSGHDAAIIAELAAEARSCFAFEPAAELMRRAKARGLTIIIVSDTYLDAAQLRDLIATAAGEDVAGLIDRVFSSCDEGISKSQGLLGTVLKAMQCRADNILHIGDNRKADYESARALGIPALHLVQFDETARQRLRFERSCEQISAQSTAKSVESNAGAVRGLQPHRAALARDEPQISLASERLGYTVLGPAFYGFEQWLRGEADALEKERGGTVHWLFMLRDGHLPHIVHEAAGGGASAARVEISRFVATAASLTTRKAYERHLALGFGLNPSTLARQMLFEESEIEKVVGDASGQHLAEDQMAEASYRLLSELRKGQRQKLTQRRARGYAERLIAHVRAAVNPQPGDTLMLIDLGYNGSAQDRIDGLLREAFDVHVAGRYLLLREKAATGLDKSGLIDARHFDPQLLEALCSNVAVIEQLATCELGSVVDYTAAGDAIRRQSAVKGAQSAVRDQVQAGAARFARSASNPPIIRSGFKDEPRAWREAAASVLTRFMFLPQPAELEVIKSFEHDVNLGSDRMVALFDVPHASEGMKRRGLFYMKGSARMFLPAELAGEDISTRLSLLVQMRFGLGLSYADYASGSIKIPAFYMGKTDSARTVIEARPTHQGYYTARVPVSSQAGSIAVQLGAVFEWFELASITRSPVETLSGGRLNDVPPRRVAGQFDGMQEHVSGIFECTDPAAFVLVNFPSAGKGEDQQMIEIVIRPLRLRAANSVLRESTCAPAAPTAAPILPQADTGQSAHTPFAKDAAA
jgi:FMN phosphatase YigB (HAD superfamily)